MQATFCTQCGGPASGSQAIWIHAAPIGAHMLQLALQQYCPDAHVVLPQGMPPVLPPVPCAAPPVAWAAPPDPVVAPPVEWVVPPVSCVAPPVSWVAPPLS